MILDTDLCYGIDCNNHGICIEEGETFHCNCHPGFTGEHCDTGKEYETAQRF